MKAKQFFSVTILSLLLLSCSKKVDTPEPYSSYISMEISQILPSDTGTIVQIYLENNSNKDFKKECIMSYSLRDSVSGYYYYSENIFSNQRIPDLPNGVLSIPKGGFLFFNVNLRNLMWSSTEFENIKSSQYILNAQLSIRDPYSQMNLIRSNRITVIK